MQNNRFGMKRSSVEDKKHWRETIVINFDVKFDHPLDMFYSEIFVTFKHKITGEDKYEFQTLNIGKKIITQLPENKASLLNKVERSIPKGWTPIKIETKNSNYSGRAIR